MPLAFKIALRFLKSSKGQTILISLGIAVGVSVQIFIGLLIQGLQKDLIDTTIGRTSQITIYEKDKKDFSGYEEIISKAGMKDDRLIHLSAVLDRPVFVGTDESSRSVLMRGLELDRSEGIYRTKKSLVSGELPRETGQILIGKDLMEEIELDVGDEVSVLTTDGRNARLVISGIFDFGVSNINQSWIITTKETVAMTYGLSDLAGAVEMQVKDIFAAKEIAEALSDELGDGYFILNWQDQNQELLSGLNGQSISSIMIQIFVLVAVVLGIASVLAITVIQKSRQIGILKAMGIKDRTASMIFLFQGLILGLAGGVLGILLGSGLLVMFTSFARNPDGSAVINITFDAAFIIFSGMIALVSAVVASLIPARKSSRLSPIEVIRNG